MLQMSIGKEDQKGICTWRKNIVIVKVLSTHAKMVAGLVVSLWKEASEKLSMVKRERRYRSS